MAWTVTTRSTAANGVWTYQSAGTIGNTFTPTPGNLLVICGKMDNGGATAISSVSGWANTSFSSLFSSIVITTSGNTRMHGVGAIVGASPGSGTASVTLDAASDVELQVLEISSTAGLQSTIGTAVPQTASTSGTYNPASPFSFTSLAAFSNANNLTLSFVYDGKGTVDGAAAITASPMTLQLESGFVRSYYDSAENDTTTLTKVGSGWDYAYVGGVSMEVAMASASSGILHNINWWELT